MHCTIASNNSNTRTNQRQNYRQTDYSDYSAAVKKCLSKRQRSAHQHTSKRSHDNKPTALPQTQDFINSCLHLCVCFVSCLYIPFLHTYSTKCNGHASAVPAIQHLGQSSIKLRSKQHCPLYFDPNCKPESQKALCSLDNAHVSKATK